MLMDLGLIMVWVSLSSSIIVNKDCHDILQHDYGCVLKGQLLMFLSYFFTVNLLLTRIDDYRDKQVIRRITDLLVTK